jgi:hypothetical protein
VRNGKQPPPPVLSRHSHWATAARKTTEAQRDTSMKKLKIFLPLRPRRIRYPTAAMTTETVMTTTETAALHKTQMEITTRTVRTMRHVTKGPATAAAAVN